MANENNNIIEGFAEFLSKVIELNKQINLSYVIELEKYDDLKEFVDFNYKNAFKRMFNDNLKKQVLKNKQILEITLNKLVDLFINYYELKYFLSNAKYLEFEKENKVFDNTNVFFDYDRQLLKLRSNLKLAFKELIKPRMSLKEIKMGKQSTKKEKSLKKQRKALEEDMKEKALRDML